MATTAQNRVVSEGFGVPQRVRQFVLLDGKNYYGFDPRVFLSHGDVSPGQQVDAATGVTVLDAEGAGAMVDPEIAAEQDVPGFKHRSLRRRLDVAYDDCYRSMTERIGDFFHGLFGR